MTATDKPKITEAGFRRRLNGVSACWLVITIASFGISDVVFWFPNIILLFSVACFACTAVLAYRPKTVFAFRLGGTLAVGTLLLRGISIIEAQVRIDNSELLWVSLSQIAITTLAGFTYAWWWLTDVKAWHVAHRQVGR